MGMVDIIGAISQQIHSARTRDEVVEREDGMEEFTPLFMLLPGESEEATYTPIK